MDKQMTLLDGNVTDNFGESQQQASTSTLLDMIAAGRWS